VKILHLTRQDGGGAGGAFNLAYQIHHQMKKHGHDSRMMVAEKYSQDPDVIQVYSGRNRLQNFFLQKLFLRTKGRRIKKAGWFTLDKDWAGLDIEKAAARIIPPPDVLFVHFVAGFLTMEQIKRLSTIWLAPVVWLLIDMMPLTGGCHYSFNCRKFMRECSACPMINSRRHNDWSFYNWNRRRKSFSGMPLTMAAGSTWIRKQAEKSALFSGQFIESLLLPVDVQLFQPGDKMLARKSLHMPDNKKIIYFGAHSLKDPRKGIAHLLNAFAVMSRTMGTDKVCVAFSGGHETDVISRIPFEHVHLGLINDANKLALSYQACDIFVCPSVQDAGPYMMYEALSCGKPVVAFEMGAAYDLVFTGKTGYRAILDDEQDLAKGMRYLLELPEVKYRKISRNCRTLALKLLHPDIFDEKLNSLLMKLTR
jgi:glycosyltransferase involved in cell wall biosynthesis